MSVILPGATVGVLGSGQLGRMLAVAARRMGYGVATFSPEGSTPTGQVADREFIGSYDDLDAVEAFARSVDVVTFEFENVSFAATEAAAAFAPVRPGGRVLHVTQNRLREKTFLLENRIPVTPFAAVRSMAELRAAVGAIGVPGVLKTAGFGYDGKGQVKIGSVTETESAWAAMQGAEAIYEKWVAFEREVSVVAVRGVQGEFAVFPLCENVHTNHILDVTVAPASVPSQVVREATEIAETILTSLEVVGVLCVEMFLTSDHELIVNELAPRPHNSGHWTIEGATTSQFEQQLRAVCGLPLGACTMTGRSAAMVNLLGDIWEGGVPDFAGMLADFPDVHLHLYGKREARPGRKMGHLTAVSSGGTQDLGYYVKAAANRLRAGEWPLLPR